MCPLVFVCVVSGLLTLAARGLMLEMARRMPLDLSTLASGADLCALASGDCPVTTHRLTLSWALLDSEQQDAMYDRLSMATVLGGEGRGLSGHDPGLRLRGAEGGWHISGLVEREVQDAHEVPKLLQAVGTQREGEEWRKGCHGVLTLSVERRHAGLGAQGEHGAKDGVEGVGRLQILTLADLPHDADTGVTRSVRFCVHYSRGEGMGSTHRILP